MWACETCTFENEDGENSCVMCGFSPNQSEDQWVCDICGIRNMPIAYACISCGNVFRNDSDENVHQNSLPQNSLPQILPEIHEFSNMLINIFRPRDSPLREFNREDFNRCVTEDSEDLIKYFCEIRDVMNTVGMQCPCTSCNVRAQYQIHLMNRVVQQGANISNRDRYTLDIANKLILPLLQRSGDIERLFQNGGMRFRTLEEFINSTLDGEDPTHTPVDESTISNLKKVTLSSADTQVLENNCPTCLDDFSVGDEVYVLKCNHHFHPICLMPWMKEHNTCPICRSVINEC